MFLLKLGSNSSRCEGKDYIHSGQRCTRITPNSRGNIRIQLANQVESSIAGNSYLCSSTITVIDIFRSSRRQSIANSSCCTRSTTYLNRHHPRLSGKIIISKSCPIDSRNCAICRSDSLDLKETHHLRSIIGICCCKTSCSVCIHSNKCCFFCSCRSFCGIGDNLQIQSLSTGVFHQSCLAEQGIAYASLLNRHLRCSSAKILFAILQLNQCAIGIDIELSRSGHSNRHRADVICSNFSGKIRFLPIKGLARSKCGDGQGQRHCAGAGGGEQFLHFHKNRSFPFSWSHGISQRPSGRKRQIGALLRYDEIHCYHSLVQQHLLALFIVIHLSKYHIKGIGALWKGPVQGDLLKGGSGGQQSG